jgi:hypothetical protein
LFQELFKDGAKIFVAQFLIDAGTGLPDSAEIVFVGKDAWMQGPLAATPRPSFMHSATGICVEKNAVVIHDLHLNHVAGHPPVFFFHFLSSQVYLGHHSFLIVFIKGDCRPPLTAVAATGTDEDIGEWRGCRLFFFHCIMYYLIGIMKDD